MSPLVIDASIAIKWVIEEEGTAQALLLRTKARLRAPDLLAAECANILWKKAQRKELSAEEAFFAARLLQAADIELTPTRPLMAAATRIAIELDHPAYDCVYLALAAESDRPFVTADDRLLRKLAQARRRKGLGKAISLAEAAAEK